MHDEQSIHLAVLMSRSPAEIDAMSYLDSLSYYQRWAKTNRDALTFQAAIHGRELK